MSRHSAVILGLALALPCAGAWAQNDNDAQKTNATPAPAASATQPATTAPAPTVVAIGETYSPLQDFVSHQALEVAMLSQQVERAKAEHNPALARTLTHMIRDHVLAENAAQVLLARRGEVSRPTTLLIQEEPAASLPDMIQRDTAMHQAELDTVQKLASNATDANERSVYDHATRATQQHLEWLQRINQGERVDLGPFGGPAVSISQIAALPTGTQAVAGSRISYAGRYRGSSRRHHRRHHRTVRRSYRRAY